MRRALFWIAMLSTPAGPSWAQATPRVTQTPPAIDTAWRATAANAIPITRRLEGNPSEAGPFRYYYQAPAGASLSAHRHSADMRITVLSGRKFILMGSDLESARVQQFGSAATFVIPAGTWHVEWWETDTLEEITGVGPMRSDRASPATPRKPQAEPGEASLDTARSGKEKKMRLGNFSVSLAVRDISASRAFYEKLGFRVILGDQAKNWLILQNETSTIGLFQGMFSKNIMTFNPGWDRNGGTLPDFDDVRDIQRALKNQGLTPATEADEATSGPASLMLVDPDGNQILVDQHVPSPRK